ncbi:hypothetical protein HPB52_013145 [Rhipicephalus sanguineus]|uniref:Uncharacterized protein n=1 Tax=Rhipicephalus sanguineus TaxID=34632 RepID=A0A9D4TA00_RHISA|nr:hypothetical protein HPB52_013145 [Rhipicephalus sanguineus]
MSTSLEVLGGGAVDSADSLGDLARDPRIHLLCAMPRLLAEAGYPEQLHLEATCAGLVGGAGRQATPGGDMGPGPRASSGATMSIHRDDYGAVQDKARRPRHHTTQVQVSHLQEGKPLVLPSFLPRVWEPTWRPKRCRMTTKSSLWEGKILAMVEPVD